MSRVPVAKPWISFATPRFFLFLGLIVFGNARPDAANAEQSALDAVKERADFVTQGRSSAGVRELIELLVTDDLQSLDATLAQRRAVP